MILKFYSGDGHFMESLADPGRYDLGGFEKVLFMIWLACVKKGASPQGVPPCVKKSV